MLENVKLCQYNSPTPIQSYCIPAVLTGHDVVAIAQTGMSLLTIINITLLTAFRFRKDGRFPAPHSLKAHG